MSGEPCRVTLERCTVEYPAKGEKKARPHVHVVVMDTSDSEEETYRSPKSRDPPLRGILKNSNKTSDSSRNSSNTHHSQQPKSILKKSSAPVQENVEIKKEKKHFWRKRPKFLEVDEDGSLCEWLCCGKPNSGDAASGKVGLLFCNISAEFLLWALSILSTMFLLVLATFHADKSFKFFQVLFWVLAFLLSLSVLLAMMFKLRELLLPLRLCMCLARLVIPLLLVASIVYTLFGCFDIYLDEINDKPIYTRWMSTEKELALITKHHQKFRTAVTIIPVGIVAFHLTGTLASAGTRVAYFFKKYK